MASKTSTRPGIDRIELPPDLAEAFRRVGDRDDPPDTLREGFAIVEEVLATADVDVELEDMYQTEPTRHAVHVGETVEHVPCVMDAMIVALARDERPVELVSEPPNGGEAVEFFVTDEEVTVTPERAVVSFGIASGEAEEADITDVKRILEEESAIPSTCSLINAFPDPEAYARWAGERPDAAVMELGIEELVALSGQAARQYTAE